MKYGIVYTLALVLSVVCAYTDWTVQKIYNKYTFPMIGVGITANLGFWGFDGLKSSLFGLLLGFSFILLFACGALKAGDVKFYMALGAILGVQMIFQIMVSSILLGGVAGIVLMILHHNGRKRLKGLWLYGKSMFLNRSFRKYEADGEGAYLCFGACIAAGTFGTIIYHIIS